MKLTLCVFLVALAAVQALVPKHILIKKDSHPEKTLKEWQGLIEKTKYNPPNPNVRGIFPQPASSGHRLSPRIINGDSAQEGQFPWQASVSINGYSFCGGSLISGDWVLTAGHCVDGASSFEIRVGTLTPLNGGQAVSSRDSILHEEYDPYTINADIGLIRVAGINLNNNVNPVLLPARDIGDLIGENVVVSGWGLTSDSSSSIAPSLNFVDLMVSDISVCLNYYGSSLPSEIICIDTAQNRKSTCNGDSGGPLVLQSNNGWTEVGIVSFGSIEGCEVGAPIGFTRVTTYLDWISRNTGLRI